MPSEPKKKTGSMWSLLFKFIIGLLMVPVGMGISVSFYKNLILINELASSFNLFISGIVSYAVLHLLFYKPTYAYVLGHEAVHAGIAWLFGGKIKSFKVSEAGGSVATDKTNFVIELSPYFVPIYAIIITLVYFVLISSYNINGGIFVYLIGFALAFHLISTIEILKVRQPDFMKSGYFFSVILVYVLNIVVISGIFSLVFPSFKMKSFFLDAWRVSGTAYVAVIRQLFY